MVVVAVIATVVAVVVVGDEDEHGLFFSDLVTCMLHEFFLDPMFFQIWLHVCYMDFFSLDPMFFSNISCQICVTSVLHVEIKMKKKSWWFFQLVYICVTWVLLFFSLDPMFFFKHLVSDLCYMS